MSTHVYVLQRLKALGDGENGATILHWTLWESALNAYCSEVQRPITPIFTPYIVFRQVNAWGKFQRRRLFECKVIKVIVFCIGSQWRLMCKSDLHESAWNCAELTDISDIFIGEKSQKFSFFRCWVIRGQSRGNTWFSRLLMVIAQIRKNENLRCIWLIDCLSQVYRLALVSARNMLVTLGPNFSSISCQNREKFEPLLLACLTR